MKFLLLFLLLTFISMDNLIFSQDKFEKDLFTTLKGDVTVTFIGHGSLMFSYRLKKNTTDSLIIFVDPYSKLADYSTFPKADIILITHQHGDHLDKDAISKIKTKKTQIIITEACKEKVPKGIVMTNGKSKQIRGIIIEAVPAYNLVQKRDNGIPYHAKGEGNGYIISFDDKRFYIAGDTENTPEMKSLKKIDVAFLPMNLPFTMTPEMVADAAKSFKPKILYPYHYGDTDVSKLTDLMKDVKGVDVRIRKMK